MDFKLFASVFTAVFVAEIGDKTQLATVFFAAEPKNQKLTVLVAA